MMKYLLGTLTIASVAIWGYFIGSMYYVVQPAPLDEDVAWDYITTHCEYMGDETGNKWYECNL